MCYYPPVVEFLGSQGRAAVRLLPVRWPCGRRSSIASAAVADVLAHFEREPKQRIIIVGLDWRLAHRLREAAREFIGFHDHTGCFNLRRRRWFLGWMRKPKLADGLR